MADTLRDPDPNIDREPDSTDAEGGGTNQRWRDQGDGSAAGGRQTGGQQSGTQKSGGQSGGRQSGRQKKGGQPGVGHPGQNQDRGGE